MSHDLSNLPPQLQIATKTGLVTLEAARIDDALTRLVAALAAPDLNYRTEIPVENLDRFQAKIATLRKKTNAAKLDLIQLLWPVTWPTPSPLIDRLKAVAGQRARRRRLDRPMGPAQQSHCNL